MLTERYTSGHPCHQWTTEARADYIIRLLNTIPLHSQQTMIVLRTTGALNELNALLRLIETVEIDDEDEQTTVQKLSTLVSRDWAKNLSTSAEKKPAFYNCYLEAADHYLHLEDLRIELAGFPTQSEQIDRFIDTTDKKSLRQLESALALIQQWQQGIEKNMIVTAMARLKMHIKIFLDANLGDRKEIEPKEALQLHYEKAWDITQNILYRYTQKTVSARSVKITTNSEKNEQNLLALTEIQNNQQIIAPQLSWALTTQHRFETMDIRSLFPNSLSPQRIILKIVRSPLKKLTKKNEQPPELPDFSSLKNKVEEQIRRTGHNPAITEKYVELFKHYEVSVLQTIVTDYQLLKQKHDIAQRLHHAGLKNTENIFWLETSRQLTEAKNRCTLKLHEIAQIIKDAPLNQLYNPENASETLEARKNRLFKSFDQVLQSIQKLLQHCSTMLLEEHFYLKGYSDKLSEYEKNISTSRTIIEDLCEATFYLEAMSQEMPGLAILVQHDYKNIIDAQQEHDETLAQHFSQQLRQLSHYAFAGSTPEDLLKPRNFQSCTDFFTQLANYIKRLFLGQILIYPTLFIVSLTRWVRIAEISLARQDYLCFDILKDVFSALILTIKNSLPGYSALSERLQNITNTPVGKYNQPSTDGTIVIYAPRAIFKILDKLTTGKCEAMLAKDEQKERAFNEQEIQIIRPLRIAYQAAKSALCDAKETEWQSYIKNCKDNTFYYIHCVHLTQGIRPNYLLETLIDATDEETQSIDALCNFFIQLNNIPLTIVLLKEYSIFLKDQACRDLYNNVLNMKNPKGIASYLENEFNIRITPAEAVLISQSNREKISLNNASAIFGLPTNLQEEIVQAYNRKNKI